MSARRQGKMTSAFHVYGARRTVAASAAETQSDISQIDFRVGRIVSAERHPSSDKLLAEQIDIGEDSGPRQICSGIAPWFAPEDITGKLVVIVANLKARRMAGAASEGMLLCAKTVTDSDDDGQIGKLEVVEAPSDAAVGERVVVDVGDATHGEAAAPNKVQKKKLYEKVAPHLCTDSNGTVCFRDS